MAIIALPPTTIRLLNSAQVLTTPASLIKELVDNALDAKATSIDILISPNTLDKVEVRDNGHGIHLEDLDSLGKRGHTSKLRSFEELTLLGGVTLGFRGEALASAVQLGEVSVTTKTEGEPVAVTVKLKATGGIEQQTRTSHPVGTTVSVKNFMEKLPVRKKVFEKEAAKSLAKIHRLLQGYALARPSIRFSLKILKGSKGSWSFIPPSDGSIKEAVLRVMGRDTALQCITVQSGEGTAQVEEDESTTEESTNPKKEAKQFIIEAFLPNPNADPSKIGSGQYLSVDCRPVSHEKGTMKKILTIFKKYIRASFHETADKLKTPFIWLNIRCPVGSYDANVEPAKDDVLFANESLVLEAAEKLFKAVYDEYRAPTTTPAPHLVTREIVNPEPPLVHKLPTPPIVSEHHLATAASTTALFHLTQPTLNHTVSPNGSSLAIIEDGCDDETSTNKKSKWGFDMSDDFTVEVEGHERAARKKNRESHLHTSNIQMPPEQEKHLNPWSIAKMAVSSGRDNRVTSSNSSPFLNFQTPSEPDSAALHPTNAQPQRTSHKDQIAAQEPGTTSAQLLTTPSSRNIRASSGKEPFLINAESDLFVSDSEQPRQSIRTNGFVTARSIAQNYLISPPTTQLSKHSSRIKGPSMPFVSPFGSAKTGTEQDSLHQTELSSSYQPSRRRIDNQQNGSDNSDLAWAMDFEQRKEEATRRRREEVRDSRVPRDDLVTAKGTRSTPHENRYKAATSNLYMDQPLGQRDSSEQAEKPFQTSLPDGDPRAYLMRRQMSLASKTTRPGDPPRVVRTKSTRLPLETIPHDAQLQRLVQPLSTEANSLQRVISILGKHGAFPSNTTGLVFGSEEIPEITERLKAVIEAWLGDQKDDKYEVEYILSNLCSGKLPGIV